MAASDPISSNIGHGALGLRSNLRQFSDFAIQSSSAKQVFLEIRGSILLSPPATWTLTAGTTYELLIAPGTFKGKTLDWVGVKTLQQAGGETLVRRESQAAVTATAGSWFYNRATTTIYVRLSTTSTDVNTFGVVGEVGFYYGNVGVTQPHFGTEKLVDGGMETWSSATNLTSWVEDISGAGNTVDREATDIQVGTYSAKLTSTGAAAGHASIYVSTTDTVADQLYCVSGRYKTSPTQSSNLVSQLIVTDGAVDTDVVQADGRTYLSGTYPVLTDTLGQWRRFEFYFLARTAATRMRFRQISGSAGAGYLLLDDVQWRPVFAWNQYEPRVQNLDQFTTRESRADIYWGSWTVGVGSFALANDGPAPGHFEELIGRFNFINAPVTVRVGGRFSDDGEEVVPTGLYTAWLARVKQPEVTDTVATFPMRDVRDLFLASLPFRRYNISDEPDLDPRFHGALRPLMFGGELAHVNSARVDLTSNAYGIYELADPTDSPAGLYDYDGVLIVPDRVGWAYADEEAATKEDTLRRMPIYSSDVVGDGTGPHVTIALSTARVTVTEDLRVYVFDVDRFANFTRNGTAYLATVAAGTYIMNTLCMALQTTGRATSGSAALTVTYSDSTHLVTIADASAATLTLLTRSGAHVASGIWEFIGWAPGSSDKTGALSYPSDEVTFSNVDAQHILRWTIYGFADDAAGTYTGTAGLRVGYASDVMRYILVRHLHVDPTTINNPSFDALRTAIGREYIGNLENNTPADTQLPVRTIFERLELMMQADLVLSGGTFYLVERSDSAPANVVDIFDNDILDGSFSSYFDETDLWGTVHVAFGQDPSIGTWATRSIGLSRVQNQFGRPEQKTFETYFANSSSGATAAVALRDDLSAIAEDPRRKFRLSVKGKLYTLGVCSVFRLNRTRGLTSTAGASPYTTPVLLRIIDKTNRADLVSEIMAVEV